MGSDVALKSVPGVPWDVPGMPCSASQNLPSSCHLKEYILRRANRHSAFVSASVYLYRRICICVFAFLQWPQQKGNILLPHWVTCKALFPKGGMQATVTQPSGQVATRCCNFPTEQEREDLELGNSSGTAWEQLGKKLQLCEHCAQCCYV